MTERQPTDARQVQIAEAALRVIASKGLGGFTAAAIARVVGLTDGSLFRHFPTKQAIVRAAIERAGELLFDGFPPSDGGALERLGSFFRQRVRLIAKHPGIARIVFSEQLAQAGGAAGKEAVAQLKQRSSEFIRGCIEQAAAEGLLVEGLNPEAVTKLVGGAALAIVFMEDPKRDAAQVLEQAEEVWSTLERLIRRPAGEPGGPPARAARVKAR